VNLLEIFVIIEAAGRYLVGGGFLVAAVVALTHWAVRGGKLSPFGGWARFVRSWSDPLLRPIEQRLHRSGGNPQQAPWWLLGLTVLGGLALLALLRWLLGFSYTIATIGDSGSRVALAMVVSTLFSVLIAALMIRVIASWLGIGPYGRIMRIMHAMTDWLLEPIQRALPNFGPLDLSPLVAYFALVLTRSLVMQAFF
jgi:YggT family protein